LFMPIFNVDGHERFGPYNRANQNGPAEMGWRTTAANLNLNRDYLKADAPEMQAWLKLYTEWLPEFLADSHVTDGADYQYVVTYALENGGNMDAELTAWTKDRYLPPLERAMDASSFPIMRYASYRNRHEPKTGIVKWASPPRLSTGYAALQNRPALLIETHMLKDYESRVTGTYEILRHTLEILNQEHDTLRRLVREADERSASSEFRETEFPLAFESNGDSVMIDYLGYEYEVVDSDLTGGKWHRFSDRPATFRIPYFYELKPKTTAALPRAYIIPVEWTDVIERLGLHGISMVRLEQNWTLPVKTYKLTDPKWARSPYEGRFRVEYEMTPVTEVRTYHAGSVVVDMSQRTSRVAAHLLEPAGADSFVRWGFFNAVFERKEYIESYVIEALARRMLEQDEALRQEFEEAKAKDAEFAESPYRIRMWFYERTPYWDDRIGIYPVGMITDDKLLDHLPK
ncbi:MAG: peptidase M14, partial [Candidatus Krumholzibacteria bacterium]|nr:peptidase M14 [Candidatus Krumholzibacteria bacterium]